MKQLICCACLRCFIGLFVFGTSVCGLPVWAESSLDQPEQAPPDFELNALPREPQIMSYKPAVARKAEIIFRKCIQKARLTKEERLCESMKEAIHECLSSEVKRDESKAQGICEKLFSIGSAR